MFEGLKGEECLTDQGLRPLPLAVQVLIAEVALCVLTTTLYHDGSCPGLRDGLISPQAADYKGLKNK
jgi:hypothetical protein